MACMTAETGTYIFAIINIIIVTLGFAVELGAFIFLAVMSSKVLPDNNASDSFQLGIGIVVFIVLILTSFITLVFSSLLLDGILKKKPGHVKAYFVYGVLEVVTTMLALIGAGAAGVYFDGAAIIAIIVAYGIYCLILHMIRRAYTKMETMTGLYAPKPLVDNAIC